MVHEPAPRSVFSPLHVSFVDEEETVRLREEKEARVPPVYSLDPKVKKSVLKQVNEISSGLAGTRNRKDSFQFSWPLSPASREFLLKSESVAEALQALTWVLERFLSDGILEDTAKKELQSSGRQRIERWDPEAKTAVEREVKDLVSVSEKKEKASILLDKEGVKDRVLRTPVLEMFEHLAPPNLFFDESETKAHLKRAHEEVPPVMEEVKRGEMIVQKGLLVTQKQQERLIQVQKKMSAQQVRNRLVTVGILVFLGLALVFLCLKHFEPKNFHAPKFLTLVLTILLLTLAVERLMLLIPGTSFQLLPGALAAILLTILWSPTLGIVGALSISILSSPLAEFRLEIVLMLLLSSLAGSFAAQGVRKRIQFLKVGLLVGAVNAAVLLGFYLFQDWKFQEALTLTPVGLANGFLVTALAFFLVPLFELIFNLTTDITLLELSDLNHPLLKRMVVEAPGTYHHSLVVSTLAEAACAVIGANTLLARVGCYFHDIGKIAHSEFFTENQTPQTSGTHERLAPLMSSQAIMNHVRDGIELAQKYKLKDVIVRFIPEHQGTGVVYYFYRKALDQAKPGEKVNADDFRYPGPKPQSRETAVALLADSTEAASRSLKEITPETIRSLVRKIINEKFIDGQLDECDLTLKDLHRIQESFVQNLMAIFHTRVGYPAPPPDPRRPDLFEADQFPKFR